MSKPAFVYVTYIKTTPEKLWQALTTSEFTRQYWFGFQVDASAGAGGRMTAISPAGVRVHDDPILISDPPRRLVYEWKSLYEDLRDEPASRVTFEIEPRDNHVKLTVTHDQLLSGGKMLPKISEGWPAVLSSLKSLLETGQPLTMPVPSAQKN